MDCYDSVFALNKCTITQSAWRERAAVKSEANPKEWKKKK